MAGAESSTRVGSGRNRGKLLNNAEYLAKLEKKPRKKRKLGMQGSGGGGFGPPTLRWPTSAHRIPESHTEFK